MELEAVLQGPSSDGAVERACALAHALVQAEGALLTVQQYFQAMPAAVPEPEPEPSSEEPVKVTPEMSPTYRKSIEKEKIRASAQRNRKEDE